MADEQKVQLNGQILSKEEFEKKKQEIEQKKGMQLVEVAPGVYKTRLYD